MSTTTTEGDGICPGDRALFSNPDDTHYLRVVVMAFWQASPPSAEPFYITPFALQLNLGGIEALQAAILSAMQAQDGAGSVVSVTYIGHGAIEMSDADVTAAGWRVLTSLPVATPVFSEPIIFIPSPAQE